MPTVLVLDFDGTVTTHDSGDAVCNRFAPPAWHDIDDQWVRGELSLPEAQKQMWALVRATRNEVDLFVSGLALRPGLDELIAQAARRNVELWLASGGFDFYIEALLGPRLTHFSRRFYNRARFFGDRISVDFSHPEFACRRCAICKGRVCAQARATGARVLFAGDGHSDRCVVGQANEIAAVTGSFLAGHLTEQKVRAREFSRLDELAELF